MPIFLRSATVVHIQCGNYVTFFLPYIICEFYFKGFINRDYELRGHKDGACGTECPGSGLYSKIQTWPKYDDSKIYQSGCKLI